MISVRMGLPYQKWRWHFLSNFSRDKGVSFWAQDETSTVETLTFLFNRRDSCIFSLKTHPGDTSKYGFAHYMNNSKELFKPDPPGSMSKIAWDLHSLFFVLGLAAGSLRNTILWMKRNSSTSCASHLVHRAWIKTAGPSIFSTLAVAFSLGMRWQPNHSFGFGVCLQLAELWRDSKKGPEDL